MPSPLVDVAVGVGLVVGEGVREGLVDQGLGTQAERLAQLVRCQVTDGGPGREDQVGDSALAGHDLLHLLVHGAGADESVADDGVGLADAPGPVAGLVLYGRVPPAVVEDDVVGGGEVEP
jgi:hypothetical protein